MNRSDFAVASACSVTPSLQGEWGFEEVTQGRQHGSYSSCGDLCAYVLWQLGVRDRRLVNRDPWEPGKNISKLAGGAQRLGCWQAFQLGKMPGPGDLVLIGKYPYEMEHVFVVIDAKDDGTLESCDYGQFDATAGKHCGKLVVRTVRGDRVYAADGRSRTLVGWVDITRVPLEVDFDCNDRPPNNLRPDASHQLAARLCRSCCKDLVHRAHFRRSDGSRRYRASNGGIRLCTRSACLRHCQFWLTGRFGHQQQRRPDVRPRADRLGWGQRLPGVRRLVRGQRLVLGHPERRVGQ